MSKEAATSRYHEQICRAAARVHDGSLSRRIRSGQAEPADAELASSYFLQLVDQLRQDHPAADGSDRPSLRRGDRVPAIAKPTG